MCDAEETRRNISPGHTQKKIKQHSLSEVVQSHEAML